MNSYVTSAAANHGRFDIVQWFAERGFQTKKLAWTPLMDAIALGSIKDVQRELAAGLLTHRDERGQTPFLLSLMTGDLSKIQLIYEQLTEPLKERGEGGKLPFEYPIKRGHSHSVAWLIEKGFPIYVANERFGEDAL